jgi:hypothetical protein
LERTEQLWKARVHRYNTRGLYGRWRYIFVFCHFRGVIALALTTLDRGKPDVYDEVKKFVLNEFRLTPVQFKNRFDQAVEGRDVTYTMFCSRLMSLLTYYHESRDIGDSFEKLFALVVADEIKMSLSAACLDQVLTMEGDKWLQCDELAKVVDI